MADEDDVIEGIRDHEISSEALELTEKLLERAGYTTTAIKALAAWHLANDDEVGSRMLESFAAEFAEHEATVI